MFSYLGSALIYLLHLFNTYTFPIDNGNGGIIWKTVLHRLMEEGFMGGRGGSLRYEKDYLPVLSKLSQASMVKIFHFSAEWKMVSVAPQRAPP